MSAKMVVYPHATGPWLVAAGSRHFTVPSSLGLALQPLVGTRPSMNDLRNCLTRVMGASAEVEVLAAQLDQAMAGGRETARPGGRAIRCRVPLMNASRTNALASPLVFLTGGKTLSLLTVGGLAGYGLPSMVSWEGPQGSGPSVWCLALALFLVGALWHEVGHAAALLRQGYPCGGVGAGLMFPVPVLFADVTPVAALGRWGRCRVDIAGVCFQIALGGAFFALGHGPFPDAGVGRAMVVAGAMTLMAVGWSLLPFMRSDGFWALSDLLGVESLERPAPTGTSTAVRVMLRTYQAANALFLLAVGVMVVWRLAQLAPSCSAGLGWGAVGSYLAGSILFLGWGGVAFSVLRPSSRMRRLLHTAITGR